MDVALKRSDPISRMSLRKRCGCRRCGDTAAPRQRSLRALRKAAETFQNRSYSVNRAVDILGMTIASRRWRSALSLSPLAAYTSPRSRTAAAYRGCWAPSPWLCDGQAALSGFARLDQGAAIALRARAAEQHARVVERAGSRVWHRCRPPRPALLALRRFRRSAGSPGSSAMPRPTVQVTRASARAPVNVDSSPRRR